MVTLCPWGCPEAPRPCKLCSAGSEPWWSPAQRQGRWQGTSQALQPASNWSPSPCIPFSHQRCCWSWHFSEDGPGWTAHPPHPGNKGRGSTLCFCSLSAPEVGRGTILSLCLPARDPGSSHCLALLGVASPRGSDRVACSEGAYFQESTFCHYIQQDKIFLRPSMRAAPAARAGGGQACDLRSRVAQHLLFLATLTLWGSVTQDKARVSVTAFFLFTIHYPLQTQTHFPGTLERPGPPPFRFCPSPSLCSAAEPRSLLLLSLLPHLLSRLYSIPQSTPFL